MKKQAILFIFLSAMTACKSGRIHEEPVKTDLEANASGKGPALYLDFRKGPAHNHPSFVLWAEDTDGNFIQTLFISKAVGTGIYDHGDHPGTGGRAGYGGRLRFPSGHTAGGSGQPTGSTYLRKRIL